MPNLLNITCIACESLNISIDHAQFLKQNSLDTKWKEGFWLYTSERFLYLSDLINQYELKNVFHLENDNMLYVDLSQLLPVFQSHYPGIAATFDSDDRCIAGFIYIHDSKAMNRLAKYFADQVHENLNDMKLLANFKNKYSEEIIDHLPIIPKEYADSYPLKSARSQMTQYPFKYYLNVDCFGSIFDAAAIGQFLGGIDPMLGCSRPGYINKTCIFNPSLLTIEWILDDQQRRIPYVVYPHSKYRINNLHIHCKKLGLFVSKERVNETFQM